MQKVGWVTRVLAVMIIMFICEFALGALALEQPAEEEAILAVLRARQRECGCLRQKGESLRFQFSSGGCVQGYAGCQDV